MKTLLISLLLTACTACAQIRTDAGLSAYWVTNSTGAVLYVKGQTNHMTWSVKGHALVTTNATGDEVAPSEPPPESGSCTNDAGGSAALVDTYLSGQFAQYWGSRVVIWNTNDAICGLALWLVATGSPTGNTVVTIREDADGAIPGTILATADAVANSTISPSGGWVNFTFSTPFVPEQSTPLNYWIVKDTAPDVSNYVSWRGSVLSAGVTKYYDSAWLANDNTLMTYWLYK